MGSTTSTKPYLIRALHDWCNDNNLTPFIVVAVDQSVDVPREFVHNGEIVLNVSFDATSGLNLGNDQILFKARFAGVPRDIFVPLSRVTAIYGRETGEGMSFPLDLGISSGMGDGIERESAIESKKAVSLVGIDGGAVPVSGNMGTDLTNNDGIVGNVSTPTNVVRVALTRIK
jgi:stringent starvation protein B